MTQMQHLLENHYARDAWYPLNQAYYDKVLADAERPVMKAAAYAYRRLQGRGLDLSILRSSRSNNSLYIQISNVLFGTKKLRLSNHFNKSNRQDNDWDIDDITGPEFNVMAVETVLEKVINHFCGHQFQQKESTPVEMPATLPQAAPIDEFGGFLSRLGDLYQGLQEENRQLRSQLEALQGPIQRLMGLVGEPAPKRSPLMLPVGRPGPALQVPPAEQAPVAQISPPLIQEPSPEEEWVSARAYYSSLIPQAPANELARFALLATKADMPHKQDATVLRGRRYAYPKSQLEKLFKEFSRKYQPRKVKAR